MTLSSAPRDKDQDAPTEMNSRRVEVGGFPILEGVHLETRTQSLQVLAQNPSPEPLLAITPTPANSFGLRLRTYARKFLKMSGLAALLGLLGYKGLETLGNHSVDTPAVCTPQALHIAKTHDAHLKRALEACQNDAACERRAHQAIDQNVATEAAALRNITPLVADLDDLKKRQDTACDVIPH